jgi:cell division septum initiation protein DivIVA
MSHAPSLTIARLVRENEELKQQIAELEKALIDAQKTLWAHEPGKN